MTTLLLSYPRSGNHFVRFIAEYITGRPTLGCSRNVADVPICDNIFPKPVLNHVSRAAEPVFQKSHGFPECVEHQQSKLVFILRDYRECIFRQVTFATKRGFLSSITKSAPKPPGPGKYFDCLTNYLEILRIYDSWSNPKFLIFYEDLITKTEVVVKKLGQFMNWDPVRVKGFTDKKDELFEMSLLGTGRIWAGSKTKGKTVRSNYLDADPEILANMASHIQSFHPDLIPYLSGYGIQSQGPGPLKIDSIFDLNPKLESGGYLNVE